MRGASGDGLRAALIGAVRALDLRKSFRSKVLGALLACVALMAGVAYLMVRAEMSQQVEEATRRAAEQARLATAEVEELRRTELARLGGLFTDSPRTLAILEAALEEDDRESRELLVQDLEYELLRQQLEASLAAFTDAAGRPVFTLVDGAETRGTDPAGVEPLARAVIRDGRSDLVAYRSVGERLYMVRVIPLRRAGFLLGTVTLGLPVDPSAPVRIGEIVGAEVCFVLDGRCAVGTPEPDGALARRMVEGAAETVGGGPGPGPTEADGARWSVVSAPLSPDWRGEGRRVLAVPLEPVLAPFERISRALRITGFGAVLLAVILGTVLSRGLTRPVEALVEATARVGEGRYDARVEIESEDELGRLGDAFNEMAEGLELKERYRGVLDKVVSREVAEELLKGDVVLGGENRRVTTLFADVSGFTEMSEGMEPQEVIGVLNECMERLSAAVEAERGVVDKYVGDEVMALFGAPVAHGDDALRAVRAALRMQEAMRELSRERERNGLRPVRVAIGINTGVAVAGNLGSPERMNYTVLGESVNLAARACQSAEGGEILVTAATRAELEGRIRTRSVGARELKGFSRPVELFRVAGALEESGAGGHADGWRGARDGGALAVLALLVLGGLPGGAAAQEGGGPLPTLSDLGAFYVSDSGFFQVSLSGRADVELYRPGEAPPWIIPETEPFVAGRVRLFTDVFVGDRLYGLVELRGDRGEEPRAGPASARVEQLFLRLRPFAGRSFSLQAGRLVSPVGGYPPRHHTERDPFVRPPPSYDVRTMVSSRLVPPDAESFLAWKDEPETFRESGAPPVWGAPYPWGALASGRIGPVTTQVAVLNSAPSGEPESWALDGTFSRSPNVAGRASVQPAPEVRMSLFYSRGPYLQDPLEGELPAGRGPDDYLQQIGGLEVVLARWLAVVRGELFLDRWEVPNVGDEVDELSWYLEGTLRPRPGLEVSARYGAIHYGRLPTGGGGDGPYGGSGPAGPRWDHDFRRLQIAVGYRLGRNVGLKGEYALNRTSGPVDPSDDLLSAQLWWEF